MNNFFQKSNLSFRKIGMPVLAIGVGIFLSIINGVVQANSSFSDSFDDSVLDTSKWKLGVLTRGTSQISSGVVVAEQSGRLSITPRAKSNIKAYNGYISTVAADFTNASAVIEVVQTASSKADTIFSLGKDENNFFRFRAKGSTLYLESSVNGTASDSSTKFNTTAHRFWRFRHISATDTVVFETSPNSSTWTVNKTVLRKFAITGLFVELNSGTSTSIALPGKALFDNFSFLSSGVTPPPPSPTPTPTPTATPTPTPTATPTPTPPPATGGSRGYLTTPGELQIIKQKADQNIQPYKASYDSLMSFLGSPTTWGIRDFTGFDVCTDRDSFQDAAARVYGQTLAYHLTGNSQWAAEARKHILEMARSQTVNYVYSGSGNGCPLTMARHTPGYVVAADLLENYTGWTAADKTLFMDWLNNHAYHLVDWASDERSTNWGGDGSNAAGIIADYFANSGRTLRDRNGQLWTPRNAYLDAKNKQLHRMNGTNDHSTGAPYPEMKNSVCRNFQTTSSTNGYAHGIQPHGGIPEETGRGTTGCAGSILIDDDSAWTYMHTTLTGMVMQAEMLLRRGDRSMYDNIRSNGNGSLEKAMEYTVTPFGAYSSRSSIFELGYRYYRNPIIGNSIGVGGSRKIAGGSNSVFLHFGTLTHGFAVNENPGLPPTVPAP